MIIDNFKLRKTGFTLIEILLALLIFTIITGSLYFSIHVGLECVKRGKANFEVFQELRICTRELQRDLRGLFYEPLLELETFKGDESSFSVICYKVSGLYKVSYYPGENSFFRSIQKLFFARTKESEEVIQLSKDRIYQLSSSLKKINFEYLNADGNWQNEWDVDKQYPGAVKVTFLFVDNEKVEHEFQNIISIPTGRNYWLSKNEE